MRRNNKRRSHESPFNNGPMKRLVTSIVFLIFQFHVTSLNTQWAEAILISPPSSSTDFRQLASLLVETFDTPRQTPDADNNVASKLEMMQWNLIEKSLTEQYTYNQYVSTTRKMRGKKYAIFVAKEYIGPCKDNDFRASYNVVGMVEMGVTVGPLVAEDEDVGSSVKQVILKPRATIGVLCVQTNFQEKGIGKLLVQKCEYVSSQVWNEKRLFAEVEPSNLKARNFFRRNEYQSASSAMNSNDESCLDEIIRNATVARRRKVETRPHIVLEKKLCSIEMNLIS